VQVLPPPLSVALAVPVMPGAGEVTSSSLGTTGAEAADKALLPTPLAACTLKV
jgi:hypothetical protein